MIDGKKISVELQNTSRKDKRGTAEGCYKCGKRGHFAR